MSERWSRDPGSWVQFPAGCLGVAFFATGSGWVLKCISFWHSNLPYFEKIHLLTTSVNGKYYLEHTTVNKMAVNACEYICIRYSSGVLLREQETKNEICENMYWAQKMFLTLRVLSRVKYDILHGAIPFDGKLSTPEKKNKFTAI